MTSAMLFLLGVYLGGAAVTLIEREREHWPEGVEQHVIVLMSAVLWPLGIVLQLFDTIRDRVADGE